MGGLEAKRGGEEGANFLYSLFMFKLFDVDLPNLAHNLITQHGREFDAAPRSGVSGMVGLRCNA